MSKKVFTSLIALVLTLSACAGQSPSAIEVDHNSSNQLVAYNKSVESSNRYDGLTTDFDDAESIIVQIILGTMKLDGTDLALTKDQSTAILPLWDEYQTIMQQSMPQNGNPGERPAESEQRANPPAARPTLDTNSTPTSRGGDSEQSTTLDNLSEEIQAQLTVEQIKAIVEMKISHDIAITIMQEMGINSGAPEGQDGNAPQPSQDGQQPPAGGQLQQGEQQPPAGGQGNDPQLGGQPDGMGRPGGRMLQPGLIQEFTEYLEKISGTESTVAFTPAGIDPAGSFSDKTGSTDKNSADVTYLALYQQSGGDKAISGKTYVATDKNQSVILVTDGGELELTGVKITSTASTSSKESSSFVGLNAAVLAEDNSCIHLTDSTIDTTGEGANGAFATGVGSVVNLSNVAITATGSGGHGVMATKNGSIILKNVDISTSGKNSAALATDRGSGTITAEGGSVMTSGIDSPAIYSTGVITVSNGRYSASGSEAAVIEGGNSITLTDSIITSSLNDKWGIMIYQSLSGDAEGTRGTFTMKGGELSLTSRKGPLFYITNSSGNINLTGTTVSVNSGELIRAEASRWGKEDGNGGSAYFTADGVHLQGSVTADEISSIKMELKNESTLKSTINPTGNAKETLLTMDETSLWNVTANSHLTCLFNDQGIIGNTVKNINGYGYTVYYDSTACPSLGGNTYELNQGGQLTPAS